MLAAIMYKPYRCLGEVKISINKFLVVVTFIAKSNFLTRKTYYFILSLGLTAAVLSLFFPETNNCRMLETLEEAEEFYKTGKIPETEKA